MHSRAIISFLATLLVVGCAHQPAQRLAERPAWVESIRSGEESLKVVNGNKVLYRRLAGGKALTQQASCDLAVIRVEEDIRKEFPHQSQVPFAIEVLVYDTDYRDCAVTASVQASHFQRQAELKALAAQDDARLQQLVQKDDVSEDEATEILQKRGERATRYALTGITKEEFEKFAKDKVFMNIGGSACAGAFNTEAYSVHGSTHICWRGENVLGYCTSKDGQCWTKVP